MDDDVNDPAARDRLLQDLDTIVAAIKVKDNEPWSMAARLAFDRVFRRMRDRLFAYCVRYFTKGRSLPSDYAMESFFSRAFWRLLAGIKSMRLTGDMSIDAIEKRICWFFKKPVEWTIADIWREEALVELPELFKEATVNRGRFDRARPRPEYLENRRQLRQLLARLPEKDRDILTTACRHLDLETGEVNWPDDERDRLLHEYHFASPNSLNQYRRRRFEELKKAALPVA